MANPLSKLLLEMTVGQGRPPDLDDRHESPNSTPGRPHTACSGRPWPGIAARSQRGHRVDDQRPRGTLGQCQGTRRRGDIDVAASVSRCAAGRSTVSGATRAAPLRRRNLGVTCAGGADRSDLAGGPRCLGRSGTRSGAPSDLGDDGGGGGVHAVRRGFARLAAPGVVPRGRRVAGAGLRSVAVPLPACRWRRGWWRVEATQVLALNEARRAFPLCASGTVAHEIDTPTIPQRPRPYCD